MTDPTDQTDRNQGDPDTPLTCREGGCACGAVRLRSCGTPWRIGLCHCLTCRKTHGAPFSVFLAFPAKAVEITGANGTPLATDSLGTFRSSEHGRRHFCRACGSPVFSTYGDAEEIEVYLGTYDQPSIWQPTYELWTVRREAWMPEVAPARLQFPYNREGTARRIA